MREKQAGSRSILRYAETEVKFCSQNFNVLVNEQLNFSVISNNLSCVEILDSFYGLYRLFESSLLTIKALMVLLFC